MFLMNYPYIKGGDLPDCTKNSTWNLLHAYIDAHIQILIDEYPGYEVQSISIFQYQCSNTTFSDQRRYNILFQQVMQKGGEPEINYIKIFHNAKALYILVGNGYSGDHFMRTLLGNFQPGVNYSNHIENHQE